LCIYEEDVLIAFIGFALDDLLVNVWSVDNDVEDTFVDFETRL